MSIVIVILGCIYILLGLSSLITKSLWIHQGVLPRPVDKKNYSRFLGIVDVVTGVLFGANGLFYDSLLPFSLVFAIVLLVVYVGLSIYAERKFKAKDTTNDNNIF